ncbi:MAG: hypothetical protein ACI4V1_07630 [Eubacteriales bacterium]
MNNTYSIQVNFQRDVGVIKPMHAVNNAPTVPDDRYGLYGKLQEAEIPYVRLHDTGGAFGGSHYVDIDNIFPDFSADENDPASYDFAFTDVLLSGLVQHGVKPFYRLGATIENHHRIRAYHIYPPKDFGKWARICEKIIRHYNEGWAGGFHMGIEYWEIWNEPDNEPEIQDNPMWKGTREQFFELYRTTYGHLKSCFPELKIGGYASCGFYALSDADVSKTAHSSPRTEYFIEFFLAFLQYIRENRVGLDFFSWHSYADIPSNVRYAEYVRGKLDEYGYPDCEVIFNEWNTGTQNRGTQKDAADLLTLMCRMQNTPTDMCMYYDGQMASSYCGLFDPVKHDVFHAYYAFWMFGRLYRLRRQAECTVGGEGVYALAASDGGTYGIAVVNHTAENAELHLQVHGAGKFHVFRVEETAVGDGGTWENGPVLLPPYGMAYFEA